LASKLGTTAYLVDNAAELDRAWFDGAKKVGLTAGASAPEILVQAVLSRLKDWGGECHRGEGGQARAGSIRAAEESRPGSGEQGTFRVPQRYGRLVGYQHPAGPRKPADVNVMGVQAAST